MIEFCITVGDGSLILTAKEILEIVAPLVLSIVAIGITFITSVYLPNKKKAEGNLIWDDRVNYYTIVVKNMGGCAIVIDSVELFIKDGLKRKSLGKREHLWRTEEGVEMVMPGGAIAYVPVYGSLYDVFAYKGHYFDVDKSNEDKQVYICVKELTGKTFKGKTGYTLGKLDETIVYNAGIEFN